MNLNLAIEPEDLLVVELREGSETSKVSVRPARAGAESLRRAVDAAIHDGYGECFWPAQTGGHYWWIFKRDAETLEIIAMWTRGGASLWEHVFRATDAASWLEERLDAELERLDLRVTP
jgi:hypothetical protein